MTKKADRSILDLLPPERQQEIAAEALGQQISDLFHAAIEGGATLGDLVTSLQDHDFWDAMSAIPVSTIFPKQKPARRRATKASTDEDVKTVTGFLKKNPGTGLPAIAEALNLDKIRVRRALGRMKKDKAVTTEGTKRSMTYSLTN